MIVDREDLKKLKLVTIEPIRDLHPHEQIIELLQVRDGNKFHVGFVIEASESASLSRPDWIGAKVVENEST